MKLVIDERVKHRLVGLAVILSIGAIFAPAIMKKSNQRIDGNVTVSVQLPAKPAQPEVDMVEKKAMFDSVKVAHVQLPELTEEQPLPSLAKAESLSQPKLVKDKTAELAGKTLALADEEPNLDAAAAVADQAKDLLNETAPLVNKIAVVHKIAKGVTFPSTTTAKMKSKVVKNTKVTKPLAKAVTKPTNTVKTALKNGYAVQVGTFTQQHNADSLISKLKGKGFTATYSKVKTSEGFVYKVVVGQVGKREQAQLIKRQLASAVQMKGFIVTTSEG